MPRGVFIEPELIVAGTAAGDAAPISAQMVESMRTILDPFGVPRTLVGYTNNGGSPGSNMFVDVAMNATFAGKRGLEFWVHVAAPTGNKQTFEGTVSLRDAGGTNNRSATIVFSRGWNHIRLSREDFDALSGTFSWDTTTVTAIRIRFNASGTNDNHNVTLWNFSYLGASKAEGAILADDGYESLRTVAFPILAPLGIPCTIGVITDNIGRPGFLTLAQYQELYEAGWALVGHSHTHAPEPFLANATPAQVAAEFEPFIRLAEKMKWTRDDQHLMAFSPYGEFTPNYEAGLRSLGIKYHRGTVGTNMTVPTIPPSGNFIGGAFEIPTVALVNTTTTSHLATVLSRHIARGGRQSYLFHNISGATAPNPIDYTTANFTTFIQECYRQSANVKWTTWPRMVLGGIS